jgi:hypothetical protein
MGARSKTRKVISHSRMVKAKSAILVRPPSDELAEQLDKIAAERGESRNEMIVDVLTAFVQGRNPHKVELQRRLGPWLDSDDD